MINFKSLWPFKTKRQQQAYDRGKQLAESTKVIIDKFIEIHAAPIGVELVRIYREEVIPTAQTREEAMADYQIFEEEIAKYAGEMSSGAWFALGSDLRNVVEEIDMETEIRRLINSKLQRYTQSMSEQAMSEVALAYMRIEGLAPADVPTMSVDKLQAWQDKRVASTGRLLEKTSK